MDLKMLVRTAFTDPSVDTITIFVYNNRGITAWKPQCMEDLDMYYEQHGVKDLIMTKCGCSNGNLLIHAKSKGGK